MERTLLWQAKQDYLAQCLKRTLNVPGLTAEIGVYLGGTTRFIATNNHGKAHIAADTFGPGIIGATSKDQHVNGDFNVNGNEVLNYLHVLPNVIPIVGYFPQSFQYVHARYSFVHVDLDTYQGTVDSLDYFWDKLNTGGILLYDDWQWDNCKGVTEALQEFLTKVPAHFEQGQHQLALTKQ